MVMRSSMPSASIVEAVSVETGCASERASTISAWLAQASSESAHSLLGLGLLETGAETGQRRLQQLHRALLRAREAGTSAMRAKSSAAASGSAS